MPQVSGNRRVKKLVTRRFYRRRRPPRGSSSITLDERSTPGCSRSTLRLPLARPPASRSSPYQRRGRGDEVASGARCSAHRDKRVARPGRSGRSGAAGMREGGMGPQSGRFTALASRAVGMAASSAVLGGGRATTRRPRHRPQFSRQALRPVKPPAFHWSPRTRVDSANAPKSGQVPTSCPETVSCQPRAVVESSPSTPTGKSSDGRKMRVRGPYGRRRKQVLKPGRSVTSRPGNGALSPRPDSFTSRRHPPPLRALVAGTRHHRRRVYGTAAAARRRSGRSTLTNDAVVGAGGYSQKPTLGKVQPSRPRRSTASRACVSGRRTRSLPAPAWTSPTK